MHPAGYQHCMLLHSIILVYRWSLTLTGSSSYRIEPDWNQWPLSPGCCWIISRSKVCPEAKPFWKLRRSSWNRRCRWFRSASNSFRAGAGWGAISALTSTAAGATTGATPWWLVEWVSFSFATTLSAGISSLPPEESVSSSYYHHRFLCYRHHHYHIHNRLESNDRNLRNNDLCSNSLFRQPPHLLVNSLSSSNQWIRRRHEAQYSFAGLQQWSALEQSCTQEDFCLPGLFLSSVVYDTIGFSLV